LDYKKSLYKKTDAELVKLTKIDPDYFGFIVARYQEKLFRYVQRISYFKKEDVEDILQEVFIKVYKRLYDYDEALKFSSWIYRITRNQTIDEIRKKTRVSQALSLEENDLGKLIKSTVDLEKEFLKKDTLKKLRIVIRNLPPKYRDILVLRFLEEKDYEEIMDILKKPKGTVATLIRRGRKMLEKQLITLTL
jgi:RNA polymerase sigma-70 factor (ECF subfamily)